MNERPPTLEYNNPRYPDKPPTGRNFLFGLLAGLVVSGIGYGASYASQSIQLLVIVLVVIVVGKIAFASSIAASRRRPGFAQGLVLSMGVVLLIFCGLCFAALKKI